MKVRYLYIGIMLYGFTLHAQEQHKSIKQVAKKVEKKQKVVAPKAKKKKCGYTASVPYAKELASLQVSEKEKLHITQIWGSLYTAYLARNAGTQKIAQDWQALKSNAFINNPFCAYTPLQQDPADVAQLKICLDRPAKDQSVSIVHCQDNFDNAYASLSTSYYKTMQSYVDPKTFDHQFEKHTSIKQNYATFHLYKALQRLGQISEILVKDMEPQTKFFGDVRDLGIIVNLQNNTQTPFLVTQSAIDGSVIKKIGMIEHGFNPLNLHTVALQEVVQGGSKSVDSVYRFDFYPLDPMNQQPLSQEPLFQVGLYSGQQIVELLQSLPHKQENVFEMNGRPTSPQHIANSDDWYMVLTQSLTPKGALTRNPDQRIQAINISKLDGPYLLNMQINEQQLSKPTQQGVSKVFQPSIVTAQVIQQPAQGQDALPLVLLPQFLWQLPTLQAYWMLFATSYIAAATDFAFWGPNTFGSVFEYFKQLGYFDTKHEYRFIVDRYNILKVGEALYDSSWLVGCVLYETNLNLSNDIPKIYTALNTKSEVVSNSKSGSDINFQVGFKPKNIQDPHVDIFQKYGFNFTYNMPYHQLYTYIFSLPVDDLEESVFAKITKLKPGLYVLTWKNKKGQILDFQNISLSNYVTQVPIQFLNDSEKIETSVSESVIEDFLQGSIELRMIYDADINKLNVSEASSIDKLVVIQDVIMNNYPISELSFELYETYQVDPYTDCLLFQDGILPKFLQELVEQDWKDGIYVVPIVENHQNLTEKNPGFLKVVFYKSDKTVLGVATVPNSIRHPVNGYNLKCREFNQMLDIYFLLAFY